MATDRNADRLDGVNCMFVQIMWIKFKGQKCCEKNKTESIWSQLEINYKVV